MSPIHKGHENVANLMIKDWKEQCMAVLGSMNEKMSRRNLFSYKERVELVQKIFPGLTIQGIPDFPTDEEWIFALDQMIRAKYTGDMKNVVFYGGCHEDIAYLEDRGRTCKIVNRFDGVSSVKVSATEIRDYLDTGFKLHDSEWTKKALQGYVNPIIQDDLIQLFNIKINAFKKM